MEIVTKSRNVEVKGPLGVLKRNFKHLNYDVIREENKKTKKKSLSIQMWFAHRKQKASVTTVASHIKNMIRGVTSVIKLFHIYKIHFKKKIIFFKNWLFGIFIYVLFRGSNSE